MKFTVQELMATIVSSDMDDQRKTDLLTRVFSTGKITDGLYLKKGEDGLLECWFRNVDENGMTDHGPTNYDVNRVVEEYKNSVMTK